MGYTLIYRAAAQGPAQSPRYHELVLDLFSDEFVGDTYNEKSCSLFKDFDQSAKSPYWFLNYKACDEISELKK